MTQAKNLHRTLAILLALLVCKCLLLPTNLLAAEQNKKQVLFVCHSISFIHPAVVPAEKALRKLGRQHGFDLT
ncbi:MAG: hypothetical protein IID46_06490, partial [Planctomycetes bacterium]|nr:hypothetical protein [Planctomycetota bacterium]